MGWIFSCFRRKQKRKKPDKLFTDVKEQNGIDKESIAVPDLVSAAKEVEQVAEGQHADGPQLCTKSETGVPKLSLSSSSSSSSPCQLGKLKTELDILTRKLLQEADQAKCLTEEVSFIRSCSKLLESPSAFKQALVDLEKTSLSSGSAVEGEKHLLLLQSMLTKIESEGQLQQQRSSTYHGPDFAKEELSKSIQEHIRVNLHEPQTIQLHHDSNTTDIESKATDGTTHAEQKLSKLYDPYDSVDTELSKSSPQIPVNRRRRSLSFSGFFVEDGDQVDNICASGEVLIIKHAQGTELSDSKPCTKPIVETVVSSENAEDASGGLFAFTPGSNTPERQSMLSEQAISIEFSGTDMFSTADSEPDFQSATSQEYISTSQTQNEKDENLCDPYGSRLLEVDSADSRRREQEILCDLSHSIHRVTVHDSDEAKVASEVRQSFSSEEEGEEGDRFFVEEKDGEGVGDEHGVKAKSGILQSPAIQDISCPELSRTPQKVALLHLNTSAISGMLNDVTSEPEQASSSATVLRLISTTSSNCSKLVVLDGEGLSEIKERFVSEAASDAMPESPHVISLGSSSDMLSSPPSSVGSNSMSSLSENISTKHWGLTPSRPSCVSSSTAETPNSVQRRPSPAKLAEDRPILGTVAAHWSHSSSSSSSSSSTQPWWDGKGIPNSTNKYKEDQKVSWHATPFEVRLERALATQGRVLQKKLFVGAMPSEVDQNIA